MKTRTSQQIRKREDDQLSACIKQGRVDYRAGKPITANPFSSYGWKRCWELGWTREAEAQRITDELSMSSQPASGLISGCRTWGKVPYGSNSPSPTL